jgi:hypothetical protein
MNTEAIFVSFVTDYHVINFKHVMVADLRRLFLVLYLGMHLM